MSAVAQLYRAIIDDVVKNVKTEFVAEGLDDSVLQELQTTWEQKLNQSGAVNLSVGDVNDYSQNSFPYDLSSVYSSTSFLPNNPFPELNNNSLYNMTTQPSYITTTPLDMNNANTTTTTTIAATPSSSNATRNTQYTSAQSAQQAASALRTLNNNSTYENMGKPQQYMAPNWTPQSTTNANTSSSSAGSIQNILRQHDGAGDAPQQEQVLPEQSQVDEIIMKKYEEIRKKKAEKEKKKNKISQLDGNSDLSDDDSDGGAGGDDDELDSELDDDDDNEPETENFVLCQYEKVTRIKNKRKTNLKDGIMHLNGRDAVFHKATGEFDW